MYARGMSQRDIADTVEDIYGFDISHETISTITDKVIGTAEEWQNRPLKKFYTFLFVFISLRYHTQRNGDKKLCGICRFGLCHRRYQGAIYFQKHKLIYTTAFK